MVCFNVQETREHYGTQLGTGSKSIETRTIRAWHIISNAVDLVPGDIVGIVIKSVLRYTMVYRGVKEYQTRGEFREDYHLHKVPEDSRFDYDENKGKVGIILSDPAPAYRELPKLNRPMGYRIVEGL